MFYSRMNVTGVLICGGDSTRFGQDKRMLRIKNKTLIELGLEKLHATCKEVLLAPRTKGNMTKFLIQSSRFTIVEDAPNIEGPVAGIVAAIDYAKYENVLVLGCDFPLVSIRFLQYLINTAISNPAKTIVPKLHNVLQPLVSVYKKSVADTLKLWIKNKGNYSIKKILEYNDDKVCMLDNCDIVDLEKELFNLNVPSDYEKLKLIFEMEK